MTPTKEETARWIAEAGRLAWEVPGLDSATTRRPVTRVGVIGAGTMGGGISMNFLTAGIPVTIVETSQEALDRGTGIMRGHYQRSADRGRFPAEEVDLRMGRLKPSLKMTDLSDCDLIIEAVFEDIDLKKRVFAELQKVARPRRDPGHQHLRARHRSDRARPPCAHRT